MSKPPRKVILIDSQNKTFGLAAISELEDAQKLVGGLIERAIILPNGDEVYVNEEGLLNKPSSFFEIEGQVFAGNGYVIGPVTDSGDNRSVISSLAEISHQVKFFSATQIQERYR